MRAATGEVVTAEELGGADLHCRDSGVSDYWAEDDAHALQIIRDIVQGLPDPGKSRLSTRPPRPLCTIRRNSTGSSPQPEHPLRHPRSDRTDRRRQRILWNSRRFSARPSSAAGPISTATRWGFSAITGSSFSNSALKATQFIEICDKRGIPLIFLQNITGYIIGREYERGGITKDGHKMVNAVATATVPKFTVIVGASFGAGNYGMCGRGYSPRFLWMWPNAQIGVMGGEQAANVLISVKNDQLAREGQPPLAEEMVKAIKEPIIAMAEKEGNAYYSTANLWDDGILDPAKTRDVLGLAISASLNGPIHSGPQGHGLFRM